MDRPYRAKSRDLYRLWTGHDLAYHGPELGSYRPEFYEGLRQEDEPVVWRFIEENYLREYGCFVRVGFDWMADGMWEISFPGSVGMGASVPPENYGMPGPLAARIRAWQANLDTGESVGEVEHEDFDYEASDAEGLEIALRDGGAVELEVPRFVMELTR